MKTLKVKAAHADRPCPKIRTRRAISKTTGRDRTMIYADTPVEVPDVRFYRRRIIKGDLVLVDEEIIKTVSESAPLKADKPASTPASKKKGE